MAKEKLIPCFRKYKPGKVPAGEKSYVKFYPDVAAAKKDQNRRLEDQVYTYAEAK